MLYGFLGGEIHVRDVDRDGEGTYEDEKNMKMSSEARRGGSED